MTIIEPNDTVLMKVAQNPIAASRRAAKVLIAALLTNNSIEKVKTKEKI